MQQDAEVDEPPRQRFRLREWLAEQVLRIGIRGEVRLGRAIERVGLSFERGGSRPVRGRTAQAERQQERTGGEVET